MTTSLGVIHDEGERLRWCLLFKPEPFMLWVVSKVINLSNMSRDDSVGSYEVVGVNRAAIAERKGAVFEHWVECSPRAVIISQQSGFWESSNSLHNTDAITRFQELLLHILGQISVDDYRPGVIGDIC